MRPPRSENGAYLAAVIVACALISCRPGGAAPGTPALGGDAAQRAPGAAGPSSPRPESSFDKVADLPGRTARLWPLEGGQILLERNGTSFALIDGDHVGPTAEIVEGLPMESSVPEGEVKTLVGRWPDAVWMVLRTADNSSRTYPFYHESVFRLGGARWKMVHQVPEGDYSDDLYQGLWDQGRGCLVGLLVDKEDAADAWTAHGEVLDCPGQPVPRPSFKATNDKKYGITAARGWHSGDVLAIEAHAAMKEGEPVPVRLVLSRPGPPNRTEILLPLPPEIQRDKRKFYPWGIRLLGESPTDVYVVGSHELGMEAPYGIYGPYPAEDMPPPMLFHFDGTAVAEMPAPPTRRILNAARGQDGTLVILSLARDASRGGKAVEVWALPRGGAWMQVPMPVDPEAKAAYVPESVAVRSRSEIWVVGVHEKSEKDRRLALFRSHRLTEIAPGSSPTHGAGSQLRRTFGRPMHAHVPAIVASRPLAPGTLHH
ncbi:hypothetical protein WMF11_03040 [Sorangium sp. So ce295]|uniref:hypothetical protein n=1 Tax=Sorangium sp. So ce295 TaxID=3133295 RepID=UPI003F6443FB